MHHHCLAHHLFLFFKFIYLAYLSLCLCLYLSLCFHLCSSLCVLSLCMRVCVCMLTPVHLQSAGSFLPSRDFWGSDSGCQCISLLSHVTSPHLHLTVSTLLPLPGFEWACIFLLSRMLILFWILFLNIKLKTFLWIVSLFFKTQLWVAA